MQTIKGQLEVDNDRGVIYFHSMETTIPTVLRICRLGPLPKLGEELLDITHLVGHNMQIKFRAHGLPTFYVGNEHEQSLNRMRRASQLQQATIDESIIGERVKAKLASLNKLTTSPIEDSALREKYFALKARYLKLCKKLRKNK